jgi:predicted PurR-regulated permease PerM
VSPAEGEAAGAVEGDEAVVEVGSPGPLTWLATFAVTVLLLVSLQHALWLVVPFLLAIVLYYMLYPAVRYLARAGMSQETAAAVVSGGFSIAAVLLCVPFTAWIVANSASGEAAFWRYVESGKGLVGRLLGELEARFAFMAQWELQAAFPRKVAEFGQQFVQEHVTGALISAAAWLPSLLLAPFLAFFILRDGRRFMNRLIRVVPNAFFERTLDLVDQVDTMAKSYFQGLLHLTFIDTACLGIGLAVLGIPNALGLALMAAVLSWIPIVGSIIGCIIVVLVTVADGAAGPGTVYAAVALFLLVRLLDDFVFMPLTIGRSLQMHPLVSVLLLFAGGAVAGVLGLIIVLPLAGVVMVIVDSVGRVLLDRRLMARYAFARRLRSMRANADLVA